MQTAHKIKLVSDRVLRAKALLLSQFKDSPNINAFLEALVDELQVLENTIVGVQEARTLKGSKGWWLDRIGEELKVSRGNYNDNDYKTAIKIAMAKKTASASKEDIERIAFLLTGDDTVTLNNPYPYMLELVGYLFCIADSPEGLAALADLFPVNTGVKLIKKGNLPFRLDIDGQGLGSGATLSSLVYHRYGNTSDVRFKTMKDPVQPTPTDIPPFLVISPSISGDNIEGSLISLSTGQWSGSGTIGVTQQWLRNGEPIVGQTGLTYTLQAADQGQDISCQVIATSEFGVASANTNTIFVSEEPPVPASTISSIIDNLDAYGVEDVADPINPVAAFAGLTFKRDGTVVTTESFYNTVNTITRNWNTAPSASVGDDYTITYTKVSGSNLAGMSPNVTYPITQDRVMSLSIFGNTIQQATGTYNFTIRSISNPSDLRTATVTLTAELLDIFS
jgi:hypothetical protein